MITICFFLSIKYQIHNNIEGYEGCVLDQLKILRVSNPKKVTLGHLNINSIPKKFEGVMDILATLIDIFPEAQFFYNGYSKAHRKDKTLLGGVLLVYVNENPVY